MERHQRQAADGLHGHMNRRQARRFPQSSTAPPSHQHRPNVGAGDHDQQPAGNHELAGTFSRGRESTVARNLAR